MEEHSLLNKSRLYCSMSKFNGKLFLSLVDYRNSHFTSSDPDKIIEFYGSFENRDDLIEWMKERPKGVANIYEVDYAKLKSRKIVTALRIAGRVIFRSSHTIFS